MIRYRYHVAIGQKDNRIRNEDIYITQFNSVDKNLVYIEAALAAVSTKVQSGEELLLIELVSTKTK